MKFQLKMEADKVKLKANISAKLQQAKYTIRLDMMQQNQEFQAAFLKRLFDKDSL